MIICGDALTELRKLPDESVNCCITSPPYYGLRDYGIAGQLGLEKTPEEYVARLVDVFREVRRVLRPDGTLWPVIGDSYTSSGRSDRKESPGVGAKQEMKAPGRTLKWQAGGGHNFSWSIPSFGLNLKPKNLIGIPWRVAFALQADGWYLRQDIIWAKPNPMPESAKDRCTRAHEYIFMLAKSVRYYYDHMAIIEPGTSGPSDIRKMIEARERIGGKYKYLIDPFSKASLTTNIGRKRAVGGILVDKQRGHGRRHAGFNDRWDTLSKEEQCGVMRNKRSVWTIATMPFKGAHFATFPPELVKLMILAGCPIWGAVLDPFFGAGTTGMVAKELGRDFIGIELNPTYCRMAERRIAQAAYQLPLVSGLLGGG